MVGESAGDFDAETIVSQKNIADSGDEDLFSFPLAAVLPFFDATGSISFRRKEKTMARLPHQADVPAGIVVDEPRKRAACLRNLARWIRWPRSCPASARSKTSPPACGRSLTRSPR